MYDPGHPWLKKDGETLDKSIDNTVLLRLKQFRAANKMKKLAFKADVDNSRTIKEFMDAIPLWKLAVMVFVVLWVELEELAVMVPSVLQSEIMKSVVMALNVLQAELME
ncbi:hypothetical protein CQW23_07535 [Capsicum baccatum]|uniref:Uncharacterized protein n=1 Tax=Capsicum baccatum TaxID=33114 RepID=A0A2G2X6H8_CAPBA|nr:hypothetical protein CQW23_07535 [Capsicum baccatum]